MNDISEKKRGEREKEQDNRFKNNSNRTTNYPWNSANGNCRFVFLFYWHVLISSSNCNLCCYWSSNYSIFYCYVIITATITFNFYLRVFLSFWLHAVSSEQLWKWRSFSGYTYAICSCRRYTDGSICSIYRTCGSFECVPNTAFDSTEYCLGCDACLFVEQQPHWMVFANFGPVNTQKCCYFGWARKQMFAVYDSE